MRIQAQHIFAPNRIAHRSWQRHGKELPKIIFLYSRECEYRPRMYSSQNEFPKNCFLHVLVLCRLSGPLRLRFRSRSRTRLRIAASIAFSFRACFNGVLDTIAPLSRGWAPPLSDLERGGWELLPVHGCEIGRDRASQSHSLSQRGPYSGRGAEAEIV